MTTSNNRPPLDSEPVKLIEIIASEVGTPRNDGTPGSALYRVPIRLSGCPSPQWCQLFVEVWNHPPSYTTMHRPGIAYVAGNRVILDGTTVDEIEEYHRETLRLVVDRVNALIAGHSSRY